jgi:alanine dehydrogenase
VRPDLLIGGFSGVFAAEVVVVGADAAGINAAAVTPFGWAGRTR